MDPDDWRTAYAVDTRNVYKTTNAGVDWEIISGNLDLDNLRTLAFIETTSGDDALLVGSSLGIFRALNPAADSVWTEFGRNLPNALVGDIDYSDLAGSTDDVLLAGVVGRGAWSLQGDADTLLGQESVIRIEGTAGADDILLQRSPDNAMLLQIFLNDPAHPVFEVPLSTIQRIVVSGLGGDDTLTVDSTYGAIDIPEDTYFEGGAGRRHPGARRRERSASKQTETLGVLTTFSFEDHGSDATQVVSYEGVETFTDNLPEASPVAADR